MWDSDANCPIYWQTFVLLLAHGVGNGTRRGLQLPRVNRMVVSISPVLFLYSSSGFITDFNE
jgi:hypothetical protein